MTPPAPLLSQEKLDALVSQGQFMPTTFSAATIEVRSTTVRRRWAPVGNMRMGALGGRFMMPVCLPTPHDPPMTPPPPTHHSPPNPHIPLPTPCRTCGLHQMQDITTNPEWQQTYEMQVPVLRRCVHRHSDPRIAAAHSVMRRVVFACAYGNACVSVCGGAEESL